jgi:hypothetical protein
MTDTKLLTEAEVHDLYKCVADASDLLRLLRERGMIAPKPEPVDPLLIEALEIVAKLNEDEDIHTFASEVRAGKRNDDLEVRIALTALRRNLELAERPTLTREMVREAVEIAFCPTRWPVGYIDAMHAALVERLK